MRKENCKGFVPYKILRGDIKRVIGFLRGWRSPFRTPALVGRSNGDLPCIITSIGYPAAFITPPPDILFMWIFGPSILFIPLISLLVVHYPCSKPRLYSAPLSYLSDLLYLKSMADINLRSIKASQALKRAKDSYEAFVSKWGKQTIESLKEEVELS